MVNSPAARAKRKQARKNYQSNSSFDESSSTSSIHSLRENVSLSRHKKRTVRARACALAARKVGIDNEDDENPQKKAADPVSTLKLNVETKPGMFIFNSFKAFLGLGNQDQNRTPMLANTPVVPAQKLQALYENQVAVPKDATNRVYSLFASLARILIVYQDPQKVGIGGKTGPTNHSFDRTGCSIHTDSKYQSRPDIHPNTAFRRSPAFSDLPPRPLYKDLRPCAGIVLDILSSIESVGAPARRGTCAPALSRKKMI